PYAPPPSYAQPAPYSPPAVPAPRAASVPELPADAYLSEVSTRILPHATLDTTEFPAHLRPSPRRTLPPPARRVTPRPRKARRSPGTLAWAVLFMMGVTIAFLLVGFASLFVF
ncbi:MAG: hypothetical protein AAF602_26740, partial [Myxococcota bacterium]